jgi:DNA-binding CsgD family transcriptional regulator/PAS domain-containing protein
MTSVEQLADALMDAAVDGGGWPDALLSLAQFCNAQVGSLILVDRTSGEGSGFCLGVDESWSLPFVRRQARHVAIGAQLVAPGTVFTDRMVIDRRAFEASGFFEAWARPSGQTDYAGVAVLNDADRFVFVGLSRGPRKGAFGPDELGRLERLAPHVRRAARVWAALGAAEESRRTLEAAFDQIAQPIFLVDASGRLRYANHAGTDLLNRGASLRLKDGALDCVDEAAGERLRGAIEGAASSRNGSRDDRVALPGANEAGGAPLTLLIAPLTATLNRPAPRAEVLVVALGPGAVAKASEQSLRAYFGLTRTEALLAFHIARGAGLKAAAKALHIAPTTARTHLNRVFAKTGAHSQVELASLIAAGLPTRN